MKLKTKKFTLDPNIDLKNYRFIGAEIEALGNRLDSAREALARATSTWSRWYWKETLDRLLFQWHTKIALYDGHGKDNTGARWNITYDYYEARQELGYDISDQIFDRIFRVGLDESWERARQARLNRCRCV